MNLLKILRAFGVDITEQHVKAIEQMLPQLPSKANEVIAYINEKVNLYEVRLSTLEKQNEELKVLLLEVVNHARRTNTHGDGNPSTEPGTVQ